MLQIYHGDGKGKTTAALGLALRARGALWSVAVICFDKTTDSAELPALRRLGVQVFAYGVSRIDSSTGRFRFGVSTADREQAELGLRQAAELMQKKSTKKRLIVLDEILNCVRLRMLKVADLLEVLRQADPATEIVLTGRGLPRSLAAAADLITEFRAERHYFDRGIAARRGIEF